MQIGKETSALQFIAPREPGPPACNPTGLMCNFSVDDVDAEHERLTMAGLTTIMPLEDHPWGDRGFAILDPNGITLYIYSEYYLGVIAESMI
jgi:uncharacterized glyoxalase superfamily protein PhnB